MSYYSSIKVEGKDSASLDAFGRWRVSDPVGIFDCQFTYDRALLQWQEINNGGSSTHLPNESAVELTTGATTSGNYAYRQTWRHFRYQPGKSQLILQTGVMGAKKSNVRQRIGYFDANNGLFFEQDSSNLKVVRRTYVGGSASDTAVNQSSWNIDKLDGTGASGITLDMTKTQIFVIDLQWLGVGRVRFGFQIDGKLYYCHEIKNANSLTVPYMTTANLPLRWEIENTAAAASATTMKQVCSTIFSEGGFESEAGYDFTANNGVTGISVTSRRALLSIRPSTLNSINMRGLILPDNVDVLVATQNALIELVYNPTYTGTPTWSAVDTNSGMTYSVHGDAAAGAFTGGIPVHSFYAPSGAGAARLASQHPLASQYPIVLDYAGSNPRAFAVVATALTGTATVHAAIDWREIR